MAERMQDADRIQMSAFPESEHGGFFSVVGQQECTQYATADNQGAQTLILA